MDKINYTTGKVVGVISNLVTVKVDGPVSQNEICYVKIDESELMAEVIKIIGDIAYIQVFESTRGLKVGTEVVFMQHMLEVTLGPGILSKNYDGLQNDLDKMDETFLKRGEYTFPLDEEKKWELQPIAKPGDTVVAGSWLANVKENWIDHKIMVPFTFEGEYVVKEVVPAGEYTIKDNIATIVDPRGHSIPLTMMQKWAIKKPIKAYKDKPMPSTILKTGVRIFDTMFPIAEGGTGFIPGPFGSGKTVLQHAIAKQADADIIIMTACGERANEVVEIFTEFPKLVDPRTGRTLNERTTIICNTSNMPVAAREASVYTGMTIAEYYRSMGLKVLLLADSTSRWAQALREMSNRLEELPGQDAFPVDLSSIISNFYARAGFVNLPNGASGSVTFLGTVSPAGGNLKEPVTESTKKVARCFYALSQDRADKKRYPAVDPIDSYSKYLEYDQVKDFLAKEVSPHWVSEIARSKNIILRGREAQEQINILGDDGVPLDYHLRFWKSELIDFVVLQQDAFDKIDGNTPLERQNFLLTFVLKICDSDFEFESFEEVNPYFKRIINAFKQMNYSEYQSENFNKYVTEIEHILKERSMKHDD
ncbi:V-type ATP synthase subunit A [Bacteroidales bacterium OttesenSCG-928-K03]|nr:V-type ATP synthase subunit A [Odoribacter sp. OttesenSCG-928-L07]MDL2240484.1 V-type ATP synthase subunit A [Bacteroidales bacterium OttesenSCG-928-K22]MDL2242278.1 V-type ATP synthase subunit A [Bacteroidales bacterium OttesenSCG-928-K03]